MERPLLVATGTDKPELIQVRDRKVRTGTSRIAMSRTPKERIDWQLSNDSNSRLLSLVVLSGILTAGKGQSGEVL